MHYFIAIGAIMFIFFCVAVFAILAKAGMADNRAEIEFKFFETWNGKKEDRLYALLRVREDYRKHDPDERKLAILNEHITREKERQKRHEIHNGKSVIVLGGKQYYPDMLQNIPRCRCVTLLKEDS